MTNQLSWVLPTSLILAIAACGSEDTVGQSGSGPISFSATLWSKK